MPFVLQAKSIVEIKNPPEEGWESASAAEDRSATSPARSRTTTRRDLEYGHAVLMIHGGYGDGQENFSKLSPGQNSAISG
jgi:hypothetical protein